MSCINSAALLILGILLLRKLVLMDRFFKARVYLITAFLCGTLLFLIALFLAANAPTCMPTSPEPDSERFYLCSEF